jgi:cytochrome c553
MKQLKKTILILAGLFVLLLSNCTYQNEVDYFKDTTNQCITDSMSFQKDIYPVLLDNCVGCHGNSGAEARINLEGYDNVKKNNVRMMNAIEHKAGTLPMPQGASKLDDCTINKLNAWIAQGLKNN